jgi:hypothetical protein
MAEDMRIEQLTARRQAIGCAWLFIAVPGIFGVVVLLASGFTSAVGWILTAIYIGATILLGTLFVRAGKMALAPMESRSGWIGWRRT